MKFQESRFIEREIMCLIYNTEGLIIQLSTNYTAFDLNYSAELIPLSNLFFF